MQSLRVFVSLLIPVFVALSACAPPPSAQQSPSSSEAPKPSAPKRVVAAIRGDPRTLSDAINFAAGGSSSAGVREIEQLLNTGLGILDPRGDLQPGLAEAVPT